jgi:hypothetical protein
MSDQLETALNRLRGHAVPYAYGACQAQGVMIDDLQIVLVELDRLRQSSVLPSVVNGAPPACWLCGGDGLWRPASCGICGTLDGDADVRTYPGAHGDVTRCPDCLSVLPSVASERPIDILIDSTLASPEHASIVEVQLCLEITHLRADLAAARSFATGWIASGSPTPGRAPRMPIEALLLDTKASPLARCPRCGDQPFDPFMRGQVQRSPRSLFSWPPFRYRRYCALICWACKNIVGYEWP